MNPLPTSRDDCLALDAADPLRALRERFDLPRDVIYLDGNSLGVLPRATLPRLQRVVAEEWGRGLIGSWNRAGWMDLPRRVGDKIARLIGARAGEVVAADSTSINLYKVLAAAIDLARQRDPRRTLIVSERENFPTDLYIAQSLAAQNGMTLRLVDGEVAPHLTEQVAVLLLTHVNYRSGAMHDLAAITAQAHAAGALTVWDLAHSAGAVPVDLHAADADFAIGCGYKYLNGGPGAPAFVWAHPRHADRVRQPLSGWIGHAAPFAFAPDYQPAAGSARFLCGTPPVLALHALDCGVDTVLAAEPLGGMAALRAKSLALGDLFLARLRERLDRFAIRILTPQEHARRGSQVSFAVPGDGFALMRELIDRGVVGDFRAGVDGQPDLLRFGFTPLYVRYVDVWDAVEAIHAAMLGGAHQRAVARVGVT